MFSVDYLSVLWQDDVEPWEHSPVSAWSIEIFPITKPGGHAAFVLDLKESGDALAANPGG
jgi:hypothetical protein